jgi:hypothetical protein
MQLRKHRVTWHCGFRKINVTIEEDTRCGTGQVEPHLRRPLCFDEDPDVCPETCICRGGKVDPQHV